MLGAVQCSGHMKHMWHKANFCWVNNIHYCKSALITHYRPNCTLAFEAELFCSLDVYIFLTPLQNLQELFFFCFSGSAGSCNYDSWCSPGPYFQSLVFWIINASFFWIPSVALRSHSTLFSWNGETALQHNVVYYLESRNSCFNNQSFHSEIWGIYNTWKFTVSLVNS